MNVGSVQREQLPLEIRRRQQRVMRDWGQYRGLQRFLADHFPVEWEKIRACGTGYYRTYENLQDPGRYKALPASCHQVPLCIQCVKAEHWRRVRNTLDHFALCTPKDQAPRFVHIVQTAPVGHEGQYQEGGDWGWQASKDIGAFGHIVWKTLQETLGHGIGAVMSYQDFGERGFSKRHPHMDLTLNGWKLDSDDHAVKTPAIPLQGNGRRAWDDRIQRHAQAIMLGAKRGNLHVLGVRTGVKAYSRILKYQMRELVDLRKLQYDRDKQLVYWTDYRSHARQKSTVGEFLMGYHEYRTRLGTWGTRPSQQLHRRYGHLSKRSLHKTKRLMGGSRLAHRPDCPCSTCTDWDRVFLEEVEAEMRNRRLLSAD